MRWFKHASDSYINLKIQELMDSFGLTGYALFFLVCEVVAQQGGDDFFIGGDKNWKGLLKRTSKIEEAELNKMLKKMGELNLLDQHELGEGNLYLPKMVEYADDWTGRQLRSNYGVSPEFVAVGVSYKESLPSINLVYQRYRDKIMSGAILTERAKQKINARLKEYSVEQLYEAIENFSSEEWWMENNGGRGMAWFFHSQDRIEQFLHLKKKRSSSKTLDLT